MMAKVQQLANRQSPGTIPEEAIQYHEQEV